MSKLEEITNNVKPSKINPTRDKTEEISVVDITNLNNEFWEQQSVGLHKCYKTGNTYANNGNKKTSIDLLQDMFKMLKQQYKDGSDNGHHFEHIFQQINTCLQLIEDLGNTVDKNCILSIIQGYTLGCLSKYEKTD